MAKMAKMDCDRERAHAITVQRAKEKVLAAMEVERVAKIFRLLAEPARLKIVLALLEGEMCVYHLLEVCDGTYSGVSHQLRILKDNNIVVSEKRGKNVEYSIADAHVKEIVEKGVAHLNCQAEI